MKSGLIQLARAAGKLTDIQFARREQHLAVLAVDGVAVDIDIVKRVVGPQRLNLRDRVVKGLRVPQADIVESRTGSAPHRSAHPAAP